MGVVQEGVAAHGNRHSKDPAGTALGGKEGGGHRNNLVGPEQGMLKSEGRNGLVVEVETKVAAAGDGEEGEEAAADQVVGSRSQRWGKHIEGREDNCVQAQEVEMGSRESRG